MCRVLITDDNPRLRQMLLQTVAGLIETVGEASDGGEAITIGATEQPDWSLMDLRMRPVDGLRATAAIEAHVPKTRVVLVTRHEDTELCTEAMRVGACANSLKENLHELPGILTQRPAPRGAGEPNGSLVPSAGETKPVRPG